jgi:hypothetical protein
MSDCSNHKKDIAGITDMKQLAEMIGDLHYEMLAEFLAKLNQKLWEDGLRDKKDGRINLAIKLHKAANFLGDAYNQIYDAWQISKPFMTEHK